MLPLEGTAKFKKQRVRFCRFRLADFHPPRREAIPHVINIPAWHALTCFVVDVGREPPEDFIRAWRHVWTVFREEGAENVLWVWSPKREAPRELYPGGEYVDWIGTGVFNYGIHGEGWFGFEYLYESVYRSVVMYDKPVMIAELGSVSSGGSRPDWFADVFRKIAVQYPATRAIVLFNNPADRTLPGMEMDWSIEDEETTLERIASAVEQGVLRK